MLINFKNKQRNIIIKGIFKKVQKKIDQQKKTEVEVIDN